MSDLIGQTIGNYTIEALLGAGGMGRAFRARHIHLDRAAALKLMHENLARDATFQERFLREARSIAALRHPHIVEVYDFVAEADRAYLVMELVSGGSLRDWLRAQAAEGKGWPLVVGIDLIRQAAEGLAQAHIQGVVHRDIKPDNMLLDDRPDVAGIAPTLKITDFGLARLADDERLTASGMTMGTPAYMSPEQCQGLETDARSDLYSLGVVLYEVITGQLPFAIRSTTDAVYKHVFELPPPPRQLRPDLSPALEDVTLRCLAKRPDDRFSSAEELAAALRAVIAAEAPGMAGLVVPAIGPSLPTAGMPGTMMQSGPGAPAPQVQTLISAATQPRLRVMDAQGVTLQVVELRARTISVGRAASNGLILDADGVSRHHLQLAWDEEQVTVTDLGASNGTQLGGQPLPPNQAVPWPWRTLLGVGPYFLRLEPPTAASGARRGLRQTGGTISQPPGQSSPLAAGGSSAFATTDDLVLRLDRDLLTLVPGQPTTLGLRVANLSGMVDHVTLSVSGVPEGWVSGTERALQLNPGEQESVTLSILVPLATESAARDYAVRLRARSRENPSEGAAAQMIWLVQPFHKATLDLAPKRAQGRARAAYQVALHNTGNATATYRLACEDDQGALSYQFANDELTLEAGQREVVRLTVDRPLRLFGQPVSHSFTVRAADGGNDRLEGSALFVQPPLLPVWALVIGALLLLLVAGSLYASQSGGQATADGPTVEAAGGAADSTGAASAGPSEVTAAAQLEQTQTALALAAADGTPAPASSAAPTETATAAETPSATAATQSPGPEPSGAAAPDQTTAAGAAGTTAALTGPAAAAAQAQTAAATAAQGQTTTATAAQGQIATAAQGQTATAQLLLSATAAQGQTATAAQGKTTTATAAQGQTAAVLLQTGTTAAQAQTATGISGGTATSVAQRTAAAGQTATAQQRASTTATAQTAVAGQTATAAQQRASATATAQTATAAAGQTAAAAAQQTAAAGQTSVAQTAAAGQTVVAGQQRAAAATATAQQQTAAAAQQQTATATATATAEAIAISGLDVYEAAPGASWLSGAGELPFGGSEADERGFVLYRQGTLALEDGSAPNALETHPEWVDNGYIRGVFAVRRVANGQHFRSLVGFVSPGTTPTTDGVLIRVSFNNTTIYEGVKTYTGRLTAIDVDMSAFDGQSGTLTLDVLANGTSAQDWLCWVAPRISFR